MDGALMAMDILVVLAMVRFELDHGGFNTCFRLCLKEGREGERFTFFKYGNISAPDHPGTPQASKSDFWARLYIMKFVDEPPPRTPPAGKMSSRSARAADLLVL
jgi:hypothetical protein